MTTASLSPLILVDGSSYLFRAYHVPYLQALSTADGQPTGAITGVLNMIKSLKKDYPNGNIVVIFDAKGKTFRNDMFPEYKANRPPMPDDLRTQIAPLHEIITAMGLPLLVIPGVEADDVIGTLAHQASQAGIETVISTGDKDMAQLVNQHVRLINTMTNVELDEAGVIEKFGVRPDQIIDYLALMGDKVDNIPGVEKCGPKTAVKWLLEHENLDNVIANADAIKGKIGENLRTALTQLPLSYQLATIKLDVELDQTVEQLQPTSANVEKLTELYSQFELRRLLAELNANDNEAATLTEGSTENNDAVISKEISAEYDTIFDQASLTQWLDKLKAAGTFAFDTETTSVDYAKAKLVGVSFSAEAGKAAYIPLAHDYDDAPAQLSLTDVLAQLKPLLESTTITKIGQNLKYDANVLAQYGITMAGIAFDTMIESYCLNSVATRHNMDALADKYLGYKTVHFEDIAGKGAKQLTFNQIDIEKAGHYAAEDADITLRLHQAIYPQLEKSPEQLAIFNDVEMPLLPVLAKMEQLGVLLDSDLLNQQSNEIAPRLQQLEIKAHEVAGQSFNLSSPKQLQQILFEELKIPVIKKTPKGAPSTAVDVLEKLEKDGYELPRIILEHRGLSKLKSTYTDKLPLMVDNNGRVHTTYQQAVAATGRLSSTDPNLQNIPIRSEEGRKIRHAFIASPGYKVVAIDYSQIELRLLAHFSEDEALLNAFNSGLDIHRQTAVKIFGEDLADEKRSIAKSINFGLLYGMGSKKLGDTLGIPSKEAKVYIESYFDAFVSVKNYLKSIEEYSYEHGFVKTLLNRKRLFDYDSANGMQKAAYLRESVNTLFQGSAADLIKLSMIEIDKKYKNNQDVRMLLQIHDELIFEVKDDMIEEITKDLVSIMENILELKVPLEVSKCVGMTWQDLK